MRLVKKVIYWKEWEKLPKNIMELMHSVTSVEELFGIQDTKNFTIASNVGGMFVDGVLPLLFEI